MGFRRYTISIIIIISMIALIPIAFLWVWQKHYMIVTLASLVLIWISAISILFYQLNKIQRELKRFFAAFEYNDSTIKFNKKGVDPSFKNIYYEFDRVIESFSNLKINKERELLFFKLAAEHTGVGLLAFSVDGNIKLINTAFTELFKVRKGKNTNEFKGIHEDIYKLITSSIPGNETIKINVANQLRHIATKTVTFRYENEEFKLIAFQDIKNEIDQTELDAWQKLIRILRHEIHNSLSPITFLSSGLVQQIEDEIEKSGAIKSETSNNLLEGLKVIRKRSIGLSEFVENYKKLTDLPLPNIQPIPVNKFLNHIGSLYRNKCDEKRIKLSLNRTSDDSVIHIDEKLIEQVLINIIANAIDAVEGINNPSITIEYSTAQESQTISVIDNGKGIPTDIQENIFTPFFSTKKNGSGIGLSLSRQIMRLHDGTLSVTSQPNTGSTFTLTF